MPSTPAVPPALVRAITSRPARATPRVSGISWPRILWTVVVALDLFWLSNPLVFETFEGSLRNACGLTLVATLVTPVRRRVAPPWTVVAVLAFGLVSAVWSTHSTLTVRFDLIYVAVAAVALAIAATADVRTIAHGMLLGGVTYVAASLYAQWAQIPAAVVPFAPMLPAGVGTNRNIMSYTLVLSLALAVSIVPKTWAGRACWAMGIATVGYGLYVSQSATGIVTPVLLCGAAVLLGWRDKRTLRAGRRARRTPWWTPVLAVSTVATALYVLRAVLDLSGRDGATLSGRTPLWSATWSALDGTQLVFGAGWGSVWQHPWLSPGANALHAEITERNGGVSQPHGHNSFFDVLPELGLVGAALFAAAYVLAIRHALMLRRPDRASAPDDLAASRLVLLGLLALIVNGVVEPMSTIPLGWFLLVLLATVAQVHRSRPADDSADQA